MYVALEVEQLQLKAGLHLRVALLMGYRWHGSIILAQPINNYGINFCCFPTDLL